MYYAFFLIFFVFICCCVVGGSDIYVYFMSISLFDIPLWLMCVSVCGCARTCAEHTGQSWRLAGIAAVFNTGLYSFANSIMTV